MSSSSESHGTHDLNATEMATSIAHQVKCASLADYEKLAVLVARAILAAEKRGEESGAAQLRLMHRRAQRAEGAAQAAQYVVELWQRTLANDQRKVAFWLTLKVLSEIRKALSRITTIRARSTP